MLAATEHELLRANDLARTLQPLIGGECETVSVALSVECSEDIANIAVVVVLLGSKDVPTGLSGLLDAAEDLRKPVLMLVEGALGTRANAKAGAVESIHAPDATIAAVLRGMLARQHEVARLERELAIAARFTGGLRGEISRMQEELQMAAQVQREFLPSIFPEVGAVRIAAFWRPASYVSGDIYDVARLDERHVGIFIADAVGHGVPAALLTMVICRGLPGKEVGNGTYRIIPPGEALARVNTEMITHQGSTTRFATAVYCIINTHDGTATLSGAGHPSPVVLRADGTMELINSAGGLMGVFAGEQYQDTSFTLHPGDRLLLFSDGFEQAFPGDPSGSRHARLPSQRYLDEFMAAANAESSEKFVDQIGRRVDMQFGSVRQADDITLLVVEHLGKRRGDGDT